MKKTLPILLCMILGGVMLHAQTPQPSEIKIKKIDVEMKSAPSYQLNSANVKVDQNQKWLAIEVHLDCKVEWAEDVQLKYYVVCQYASSAKGDYVPQDRYDILASTVTVVNLQGNSSNGRRSIVPVFLDSTSVKKYGQGSVTQLVPEVAVQVMYKGVLQDQKWWKDEKKSGRFWEAKQPRTGVLLNFTQSPWFPAYFDYYEQVKPLTIPTF